MKQVVDRRRYPTVHAPSRSSSACPHATSVSLPRLAVATNASGSVPRSPTPRRCPPPRRSSTPLRGGGGGDLAVVESFGRRDRPRVPGSIPADREPPVDLRRASASRTLDDRLPARAPGYDGDDRRRVREFQARGAPVASPPVGRWSGPRGRFPVPIPAGPTSVRIDPRTSRPRAHAAGTATFRSTRRRGRLLVRSLHRRSVHSIAEIAESTQRRRLRRDPRRERGGLLVVQCHRDRGDRRGVPGVVPGGRPRDADGVANGRSMELRVDVLLPVPDGGKVRTRQLCSPAPPPAPPPASPPRGRRPRGGERGGARHRGSRQHRRHRIRAARPALFDATRRVIGVGVGAVWRFRTRGSGERHRLL